MKFRPSKCTIIIRLPMLLWLVMVLLGSGSSGGNCGEYSISSGGSTSGIFGADASPISFRNTNRKPPAKIGVSFSPAGLLTPFHIGAAAQLKRLGFIDDSTALAGSSGGALAAVTTALNIPHGDALTCSVYVAQRCRDQGPRATLRIALDEVLNVVLPEDSHLLLNQRLAPCTVAYAEIQPRLQSQFISHYLDKADVMSALRASCNIPFYFNGNSLAVRVRGALAVDGYFTTPYFRFGCPHTGALEREILVSPYSAALVLLNPEAARRQGDTCRYDVISPDLLVGSEQWPFSLLDVIRMSFGAPGSKLSPGKPISDEELADTYDKLFEAGAQAVTNWYNIQQQQEQKQLNSLVAADETLQETSVNSNVSVATLATDPAVSKAVVADVSTEEISTTVKIQKWWNF